MMEELSTFEQIALDILKQQLIVSYRNYDALMMLLQLTAEKSNAPDVAERLAALHSKGQLVSQVAYLSPEYFGDDEEESEQTSD
jgi:hypothetical protein